jgi:hypothetical protein
MITKRRENSSLGGNAPKVGSTPPIANGRLLSSKRLNQRV